MSSNGPKAGQDKEARPLLPRRRYRSVSVEALASPAPWRGEARAESKQGHGRLSHCRSPRPAPSAATSAGGAFRVLLDGKPMRTPSKRDFAVPGRALAQAIAGEWSAQRERIDPRTMPLTTLANTAIDGVSSRELAVRADIVKYAGSDLLCYRAQQPEALVRRQSEAWDGILDWASEELGVRFAVGKGLMPIPQPAAAPVAVASALAPLDPFSLAALHVITTLSGSALLALAHLRGRLTAEGVWAAAHVDEFFQIGQWGNDAEADARRQRRWAELEAASRMLKLLGS